MAKTLGITASYLGQLERGDRPCEPRTLLAAMYLAEHPQILAPIMPYKADWNVFSTEDTPPLIRAGSSYWLEDAVA